MKHPRNSVTAGVLSLVMILTATKLALALGPSSSKCVDLSFLMQSNAAGDGPESVALGDLDGDGDLDMAVAHGGGDDLGVFLNGGDGTFTAGQTFATGEVPSSVALGDLDGDGHLDAAVTNWIDGDVSILYGMGDGRFHPQQRIGVGDVPARIALGDLDGDGDLDMAVANIGSNDVSIVLSLTFPFIGDVFVEVARYETGQLPRSVALGDLDGDGDLDMALVNEGSHDASLFMNSGNGSFAPEQRNGIGGDAPGTGRNPWDLAIGDVDGDGDLDIVVAVLVNHASVLLNNGDGTIASVQHFDVFFPWSIALADLDGDEDLDMALVNFDSDLSILQNNGDGTYSAEQRIGAGEEPATLAMGDLDGDGDVDIAVANFESNDVTVLLNQCSTAICSGDCDANGSVDFGDLVAMLGEFGTPGSTPACDADKSRMVDFGDLVAALGLFGECP